MEVHITSKWFDGHYDKKKYFEENVNPSLFPFIEKNKIKANKIHKLLLDYGNTYEEKMFILKKFVGAYTCKEGDTIAEKVSYVPNLLPIVKITPSLELNPFMHGWYSPNSRIALEGAVQYYKPKIVFELGVWYGMSSVGILQASKRKLDFYGFDFFTPSATNPSYVSKSPIDKMFLNHFRFESAVSNVAKYSSKHNIHLVVGDVFSDIGIIPDLIYIDAIKDTHDLRKMINHYLKLNPKIVIVGDDYVFDSVKIAVKHYDTKKVFGNEAYIITNLEIPEKFPEPVSDFSSFPKLVLTSKEKTSIPKSMQGYI